MHPQTQKRRQREEAVPVPHQEDHRGSAEQQHIKEGTLPSKKHVQHQSPPESKSPSLGSGGGMLFPSPRLIHHLIGVGEMNRERG